MTRRPAPSPCTSNPSPTARRWSRRYARSATGARRRPGGRPQRRRRVRRVAHRRPGDLLAYHPRRARRQAGAVLVDDERELVDAVGAVRQTAARHRRPRRRLVTAQAGPGPAALDDLRAPGVASRAVARTPRRGSRQLLPPLTYQATRSTRAAQARLAQVLPRWPPTRRRRWSRYALAEPDAIDLPAVAVGGAHGVPVVVGIGGPRGGAARHGVLAAASSASRSLPSPAALAAAVAALVAGCPRPARLAHAGSRNVTRRRRRARLPASTSTRPRSLVDRSASPRRHAGCARDRAAAQRGTRRTARPRSRSRCSTPPSCTRPRSAVSTSASAPRRSSTPPWTRWSRIGARRLPGRDDGARGDRPGRRRAPRPGVRPDRPGRARRHGCRSARRRRRPPAPLPRAEAAAMLDELAARALLDGWRGGPVARPRRVRRRCWPRSATCSPRNPGSTSRDQPAAAHRRADSSRSTRSITVRGRSAHARRRRHAVTPAAAMSTEGTVPWPEEVGQD